MKITDTIISIPPYISTSWDNISSLHMEDAALVFTLLDGKRISIQNLSSEVIEQVFSAHASFLESHLKKSPNILKNAKAQAPQTSLEQLFTAPLSMASFENIGQMGQMLQHNPNHSDLPPIPEEVAGKIAALAKIIPEDELLLMPPPEANCNCMYCQINRILRRGIGNISVKEENQTKLPDHPQLSNEEEKITEDELRFEQWKVEEIRENMYSVTNKLDPKEQYTVYLGTPVGCTCGKPNCEHIIAVLRS